MKKVKIRSLATGSYKEFLNRPLHPAWGLGLEPVQKLHAMV
jgi:hypothetical protein